MKYEHYLAWEEEISDNMIWVFFCFFCSLHPVHLLSSRHLAVQSSEAQSLSSSLLYHFLHFNLFLSFHFSLLPNICSSHHCSHHFCSCLAAFRYLYSVCPCWELSITVIASIFLYYDKPRLPSVSLSVWSNWKQAGLNKTFIKIANKTTSEHQWKGEIAATAEFSSCYSEVRASFSDRMIHECIKKTHYYLASQG